MKRVGYLYEKMLDKKFISYCYDKAIKGKRNRWDVRHLDKQKCVDNIYDMLKNRTFTPATPRIKTIHDKSSNKEREISIVPFYPDGVIQNMIVTAMQPVLKRNMYPWTCASIPDRGIHYGTRRMKRLLKHPRKTKYCLKLDIHHFYPSIDHDILMKKLSRKIKDREFLSLIEQIIGTNPEGLAIGFYLSQWLSNFYLEDLDWFIHNLDGVYGYVRYMDDMTILGSNKRKLRRALDSITEFLEDEKLELKGNYQIFPVKARGVDFMGFRFYHGKTKIRRKLSLRIMRQVRLVEKDKITKHGVQSLTSRMGWVKYSDNRKFREKYLRGNKTAKYRKIINKRL